jgi:hypothetical protein
MFVMTISFGLEGAMRRRDFLTLLGGIGLASPLSALAQEAGRTYRVGGLSTGPRTAPYFMEMFDELRRAGFVEAQNLTIDWHRYGTRIDLIPEFVASLSNPVSTSFTPAEILQFVPHNRRRERFRSLELNPTWSGQDW